MPSVPSTERQRRKQRKNRWGQLTVKPSQQSPASRDLLSNLSNDLLLTIAEYVASDKVGLEVLKPRPVTRSIGPAIPKSIINLSLCSRRLYQIVIPLAHAHFQLLPVHGRPQYRLAPFLFKILKEPERVGWIRVFTDTTMLQEDDVDMDCPLDHFGATDEDWMRIQSAVSAASSSKAEKDEWLHGMRSSSWDAMVTLFISLLPNLEELEISKMSVRGFPILSRYLTRAAKLQEAGNMSTHAMPKLRVVMAVHESSTTRPTLQDLVIFLRFQTVQSFHAQSIMGWDYEDNILPGRLDSSLGLSIKQLYLDSCNLNPQALAVFLRCFTSLEHLRYRSGSQVCFDPPRVMEALEHMKPCLKSLTIDDYIKSDDYYGYPLGSLAEFRQLKSIDTPASTLIGSFWDTHGGLRVKGRDGNGYLRRQSLKGALPRCLESLRLRDCHPDVDIVPEAFDLILGKDEFTPALKRLDLEWKATEDLDEPGTGRLYIYPGFIEDVAHELWDACREAGVEMVMEAKSPKARRRSQRQRRRRKQGRHGGYGGVSRRE